MTMLSFHLITGLMRRFSMGGIWELFSKYELDGNKTGFLKTGCAVSQSLQQLPVFRSKQTKSASFRNCFLRKIFFRIWETLSLNRVPSVRLYFSISTQRDLSFFRVPNKTKRLKTNSPDHFSYNEVDNQTWTLGFMYFFSFPSRDWTEGNKFVLVLHLFLFLLATPRTRTLRWVTCKMRYGKLKPKASISKKISQHWKIPGYYYKKPSCIHWRSGSGS